MLMANEQYQQNSHGNSINKTATSERLDSWASRLWRGIELVFKSLHCFTVRPIFSTRPITRMKIFSLFLVLFFFLGGGVLSSNAFTIWCCIPISRPPRVIRRFKRRSCLSGYTPSQQSWGGILVSLCPSVCLSFSIAVRRGPDYKIMFLVYQYNSATSDTTWHYKPWSTLVEVIVYCLFHTNPLIESKLTCCQLDWFP